MTELQIVADQVNAGTYWEVFPDPHALKTVYRQLARVLHPDRHTGADRDIAAAAFARLATLQAEAEQALAAGHYGRPAVMAVITGRAATHTVTSPFREGDLASLFRASTATSDGTIDSLVKVARSAGDNDLLAAEAAALKRLHATPDKLERHFPDLLDTFIYPEGRRRANALSLLNGVTLDQVRAAYPDGVDARHIAWMWRRLLMALGYAHDRGIIHGAVLPPHVLIEPGDHAVMLIDWCYSSNYVDDAPPIKAMLKDWRHFYPEEICAKQTPTPATDIAMAAYTMTYLAAPAAPHRAALPSRNGEDWCAMPRQMRAFFKGCVPVKQRMRPQNAWVLLKEFDEVLELIGEPFYPRRWVEFTLPSGVA